MAHALGANVIVLQSHRAWAAAQRRARERSEAIRRHPSYRSRLLEPEAVLDDNSRPRAALREILKDLS